MKQSKAASPARALSMLASSMLFQSVSGGHLADVLLHSMALALACSRPASAAALAASTSMHRAVLQGTANTPCRPGGLHTGWHCCGAGHRSATPRLAALLLV